MKTPTVTWDQGDPNSRYEEVIDLDMSQPLVGRELMKPDGTAEIISAVAFEEKLYLLMKGPEQYDKAC